MDYSQMIIAVTALPQMRKFVINSQLNQTHGIFLLDTTINLNKGKEKKVTQPETESETGGLAHS